MRFYDEDTVLINDYSKEGDSYYSELEEELRRAGLELIPVPYNPYHNVDDKGAIGFYINFLEMKDFILLPFFGLKEDEETLKLFEELFPSTRIRMINSRAIANQGGVLHCISWNILKA